jgi:hypothetical protein
MTKQAPTSKLPPSPKLRATGQRNLKYQTSISGLLAGLLADFERLPMNSRAGRPRPWIKQREKFHKLFLR